MLIFKKYINIIGLSTLIILLIIYNLKTGNNVIYCGKITKIESFSIKSIKTDFLIITMNSGEIIKIPSTDYYQPVGKSVEIVGSTDLFGNKLYKQTGLDSSCY